MRARIGSLLLVGATSLVLLPIACGDEPEPAAEGTPLAEASVTPDARRTPAPALPTAVPTRTRAAAPPGVEPISPVEVVTLPEDLVLYISPHCLECDAPPGEILRIYQGAHGPRIETLFSAPQLTTRSYITSIAAGEDGELAVGLCSRGECGPLGAPSSDAETMVYASSDGGVTWRIQGRYEGAIFPAGFARDGRLLATRWFPVSPAGMRPESLWLPSAEVLPAPAGAHGDQPATLLRGEVVWPTPEGGFVDASNVSHFVLPPGAEQPGRPVSTSDGRRLAIAWTDTRAPAGFPPVLSVYEYRPLSPSRRFAAGSVRPRAWLDGDRLLVNAVLDPAELGLSPASGQFPALPGILDVDSGRLELIGAPFIHPDGSPLMPGANTVLGGASGRFARVAAGSDGCASVREVRDDASRVVACVSPGVLLDLIRVPARSEEWALVDGPAGAVGWVHTRDLWFSPAEPGRPFPAVEDALDDRPQLLEIALDALGGPDAILERTERRRTSCSYHGEVRGDCTEMGKELGDTFESVTVARGTIDQHSTERVREWLRGIAGDERLLVHSAWELPPEHEDLGRYAIALRGMRFVTGGLEIDSVVLFVDPDAARPIRALQFTSPTWTVIDAMTRELTGSVVLYEH